MRDQDADKVNQNSQGWTALHFACDEGFVAIVKALLEAKVENPNVVAHLIRKLQASTKARSRRGGVSPLHLAAKSSPVEAVKSLVCIKETVHS